MKNIVIACEGYGTLPLNQMTPLQGSLKTLSDEAYEKLKQEILEDGFSFPFVLWEDEENNTIYIIDGHQRHECLTRMKAEGYPLPQFPFVWVKADSLDHAKKKVLAAASQYGMFTEDGVAEFLKSFDHEAFNLAGTIEIPNFNFEPSTILEPDPEDGKTVDVQSHQRQLNQDAEKDDSKEKSDAVSKCPQCGFVITKTIKIRKKQPVIDKSEQDAAPEET